MLSDEEDDNDCMSKKILFSLAMLPPFDDDLPRGKLPFDDFESNCSWWWLLLLVWWRIMIMDDGWCWCWGGYGSSSTYAHHDVIVNVIADHKLDLIHLGIAVGWSCSCDCGTCLLFVCVCSYFLRRRPAGVTIIMSSAETKTKKVHLPIDWIRVSHLLHPQWMNRPISMI